MDVTTYIATQREAYAATAAAKSATSGKGQSGVTNATTEAQTSSDVTNQVADSFKASDFAAALNQARQNMDAAGSVHDLKGKVVMSLDAEAEPRDLPMKEAESHEKASAQESRRDDRPRESDVDDDAPRDDVRVKDDAPREKPEAVRDEQGDDAGAEESVATSEDDAPKDEPRAVSEDEGDNVVADDTKAPVQDDDGSENVAAAQAQANSANAAKSGAQVKAEATAQVAGLETAAAKAGEQVKNAGQSDAAKAGQMGAAQNQTKATQATDNVDVPEVVQQVSSQNSAKSSQSSQSTQTGNAQQLNNAAQQTEQGQRPAASETAARQAADLAKNMDDGSKARVQVTVNDAARNAAQRPEQSALTQNNMQAATQTTEGEVTQATQGRQVQSGNNDTPVNRVLHQQNQQQAQAAMVAQTPAAQQAQAAASKAAANAQQGGPNMSAGTQTAQAAQAANTQVNAASGSANTGSFQSAMSGDGMSGTQTQQSQQSNTTQQTQQTQAPRQTPEMAQKAVDQVKVEINRGVAAGQDNIKIQLRPDNLGRIEVKLELGGDGRVQAQVIADKSETLDMMRNDSRGLENALKDAGLRADNGSLSFMLRGDGNNAGGNGQGKGRVNNHYANSGDDLDEGAQAISAQEAASMRASARGGVDVRV